MVVSDYMLHVNLNLRFTKVDISESEDTLIRILQFCRSIINPSEFVSSLIKMRLSNRLEIYIW